MPNEKSLILPAVALGLGIGTSTALLKYMIARKKNLKSFKSLQEHLNASYPILDIDPNLNDVANEKKIRSIGIKALERAYKQQLKKDNVNSFNVDTVTPDDIKNAINAPHEKVAFTTGEFALGSASFLGTAILAGLFAQNRLSKLKGYDAYMDSLDDEDDTKEKTAEEETHYGTVAAGTSLLTLLSVAGAYAVLKNRVKNFNKDLEKDKKDKKDKIEKVASWNNIKDQYFRAMDKEASKDSDKTVLDTAKETASDLWERAKDKNKSVFDLALLTAALGATGYGSYKVTKRILDNKTMDSLDDEEMALRNLQDNLAYNAYARSRNIPIPEYTKEKTAEEETHYGTVAAGTSLLTLLSVAGAYAVLKNRVKNFNKDLEKDKKDKKDKIEKVAFTTGEFALGSASFLGTAILAGLFAQNRLSKLKGYDAYMDSLDDEDDTKEKTAEEKDPRSWGSRMLSKVFLTDKGNKKAIAKAIKGKNKSLTKGATSLYALYFVLTAGLAGLASKKFYKNHSKNNVKKEEVEDYFKNLAMVKNAPIAKIQSKALNDLDAIRRLGTPSKKQESTISSLELPPVGSNANISLPSKPMFKSRSLRDASRELEKEKEDTSLNPNSILSII